MAEDDWRGPGAPGPIFHCTGCTFYLSPENGQPTLPEAVPTYTQGNMPVFANTSNPTDQNTQPHFNYPQPQGWTANKSGRDIAGPTPTNPVARDADMDDWIQQWPVFEGRDRAGSSSPAPWQQPTEEGPPPLTVHEGYIPLHADEDAPGSLEPVEAGEVDFIHSLLLRRTVPFKAIARRAGCLSRLHASTKPTALTGAS